MKRMRKVTLGLANSLDNYIARDDGGYDWLQWNDEVATLSAKFMKTVDALLIGRKTFEVMLGAGQASYPGPKNYVFTRTRKTASSLKKKAASKKSAASLEIVTGDAAEFVAKLKRRKGKGIVVFGGGELAKSLFEADLIDEVVLNIHPVLLGSGIPLFPKMSRQVDLSLLDQKVLTGGCLVVTYSVKHQT